QTNRELNGRHGRDQVTFGNGFQQIDVRVTRCPRRERHKGWLQRQSRIRTELQGAQKVGACVALVQLAKDFVIQRLDGTGDEEATRLDQLGESMAVTEQVFNLDGDIVGQLRKLRMQPIYNARGVSDPVEKVGIAKSNVLRTRSDLLANIGQNNLAGN